MKRISTIAILGDPGSGKTTLLKHICIENCFSESNLLPIFLPIRDIFASKQKIIDAINREIQKLGGTDNPQFLSDFSIKNGRILSCVDGFDEIDIKDPNEARKILREISNQLMEIHYLNPKNIIIISARTESWKVCRKEIYPIFKEFEILPFTQNNTLVFVTKWFEKIDPGLKNDLLDEFRHLGWPEFTSNPLLLALTCYLFEKKRKLSRRMHNLYDKCIDLLLEEWATSRRISKREIVKELNSDIKKDLLTEIAFGFHNKGKSTFTRDELVSELEEQLEKFGINSKQAGDVFDEFASQHGLIKSWSFEGYCAFPHLVFQEYLSAKALREKPDGFMDLIQHKDDPFWRNTLKIYSSMGDLSPFLNELLNQPDNILHSNLFLAANCLSEGTKLSDKRLRERIILPLLDLATEKNIFFSEQATDLLVKIGDDRSNEILKNLYIDKSGDFIPNCYALKYFLKLEDDKKYPDFIDFILKNKNSARYGIEALNWLPHKKLIQVLQYLIEFPDEYSGSSEKNSNLISVKSQSISLLVTIGQDEALPILLKILKNRNVTNNIINRMIISSLAKIRNPKISLILEQIIRSDNYSSEEKIIAIGALNNKSESNKTYLLSVAVNNEFDEITRQLALLSLREYSDFDLDEDDLDSLQRIVFNTKLKDWRCPAIASKLIRIIGGIKAFSILKDAKILWQDMDHPHKKMIVNSINIELLRLDEDKNIETILEQYILRENLPIEFDLPDLVYKYYITKPNEALDLFIKILRANETQQIRSFDLSLGNN